MKTPSHPPVSDSSLIAEGALVMFENDGSALLGVVTGFKKQHYQVLTMRGREVELRPTRLHSVSAEIPASHRTSNATRTEYLLHLFESAHKRALTIDLGEIWSLVREEAPLFSTAKIAELYLGRSYSAEEYLALRLALLLDRIYFKRRDDEFAPREPEIVKDLKKHESVAAEKARLQDLSLSTFLRRIKDPSTPIPDEVWPLIELLEDTAAENPSLDHNRQRDAREFLAVFGERSGLNLPAAKEQRAFAVLQRIHHFTHTTNLPFYRHRPPNGFAPTLLSEAAVIATRPLPPLSKHRVDLRDLFTMTVDDISTKDMDDAISLETTSSGYRLGIHISDVASAILPATPLDNEAQRRATSLYLAGTPINMLPPLISESYCSLVADHDRPTVSCLFELDRNFEVLSASLVPALIRVRSRKTYDEVDYLLESGDPLFTALYGVTAANDSRRIMQGATKVTKKDVQISPSPDGSFTLLEIDEDNPARSLVSELMVMANSFMAKFAAERGIPVVFRGQEAADDSNRGAEAPHGPAQDYQQRSKMKKSITQFDPIRHASLGLDSYIQVTSPIRRYVDLCNQRQLVSFIETGNPFYTRQQYIEIFEKLEEPLGRANAVSKETRRYWLLRYLESLHRRGKTVRGTVVRLEGRTPLVELDTLYTTVFAKLRPDPKLGDSVELKIESVDPVRDYLKLEEIG